MHKILSPTAVHALRCPYCHATFHKLNDAEKTARTDVYVCENGHSFDQSKQGYLTLLGKGSEQKTADTLDMVVRRQRFLEKGFYEPFAQTVADTLKEFLPKQESYLLGDFGAGPGYYSKAVVQALSGAECIAFDLSKRALQRSKAEHVYPIVADTWEGFPLKDDALDGGFNIFAPRNAAEFSRVLKAGAPLIVSTPTPQHLLEIRSAADLIKIGRQDHTKREDLHEKFDSIFDFVETRVCEFPLVLESQDVEDLVMMGPNAYHTNLADLQKVLSELPHPFEGTFSVETHIFLAR